jgi:hypothetical protein
MDPSSLMAYCCLHTKSAGSVRLLFTDERLEDYPENTSNSVSIRLCIFLYLRIVMAKCDLQTGLHQISPLSLSLLLTHISSNASDKRQPDHGADSSHAPQTAFSVPFPISARQNPDTEIESIEQARTNKTTTPETALQRKHATRKKPERLTNSRSLKQRRTATPAG